MVQGLSGRAERFRTRAIAALKEKGLRVTGPRLEVVRVLAESQTALSPHQIHAKVVAAGGHIDVVSVYRILHTFQPLGLVHYIGALDGYLACGLEEGHGPHSKHLVCRSCSRVEEMVLSEAEVASALDGAFRLGWSDGMVQMEIVSSACSSCRASADSPA